MNSVIEHQQGRQRLTLHETCIDIRPELNHCFQVNFMLEVGGVLYHWPADPILFSNPDQCGVLGFKYSPAMRDARRRCYEYIARWNNNK
jgi:hypothetical protein